ncbi:pre-tRNA nuclear export protein [Ascosphaera acerosa]|nr:pre-tRNA nuclear export protein [Ascosphaera acerosa]
MEVQIINAIEIAANVAPDPALQQQAVAYLQQLRADPAAWPVCLSIFTRTPRLPDIVRHVALEIVASATQAGLVDAQGLLFIKETLLEYVSANYGPAAQVTGSADAGAADQAAVQNKVAQLTTYLFQSLYASGWESFFDDLLRLTGDASSPSSQSGVVFYLRVLNCVHEEIGDVLVSRSRADQDKANALKDLIRERDVRKIVASWQSIMSRWQDESNLIAEMCLRAIGSWVSWIDISLVVNQPMLDLLFRQLSQAQDPQRGGREKVRDVTVDVFTEIVSKKMKPSDKIDMITFLNLGAIISQLTASRPLAECRFTSDYDTDLAETVARLVNMTMLDVVKGLEADPGTHDKAEALLQAFMPHILRYLSDEYDEICSTVIPSVSELLTYFRKASQSDSSLSACQAPVLLPILKAIIAKMRYDETSSWGDEDEQSDEAEFQELRKRLNVLQQIIAATNQQVYIDAVTELVGSTLEKLAQQQQPSTDWRDLDLALYEMFLFGDVASRSGSLYTKGKPNNLASERLVEMMTALVNSDIRSSSHPAINLQFMELCVRYGSFFDNNPQLIAPVLETFMVFAHHPVAKIKTRAWYLFYRFVKHLKNRIEDVAETVVTALSDLLVIRAEINRNASTDGDANDGDASSDDPEGSADAVFNQQLYLFEAVAVVCSAPAVPVQKQVLYFRTIMAPIFGDLEQNIATASTRDERALLQVHHDIMALGTLTKGYSDWTPYHAAAAASPNPNATPPALAPEPAEVFAQVSEATLVALESLNFAFSIRTAARSTFSRLIGVRGTQILPQLPRWIEGLIPQASSKDELALFLRLQDQVIFGFKTEIFSILNTLLTPFLQRVLAGLSEPVSGTDDEIQLAELKREYLNYLLIILNNNLSSVIVSSENQPIFETVVTTVEHFARDADDLPTSKMAFSVLARMSALWGGPDIVKVATSTANSKQQQQQQQQQVQAQEAVTIPGFQQFMISRFSPLCWSLPMSGAFNAKDALSKHALAEAATLQKTIYTKIGQQYLDYLTSQELPGMGMGQELAGEYVTALASLDTKQFKVFFQVR